ncbi:aldo/keto reductase [Fimbriiglobus ruber]|uniref:Ferredoxin n=1 Tax=Fimbriiglobus ruber TaxID=1908690 RepID=A0A225DQ97_9BACT|nr:aldo/keto reductase [Fimbriiglobus ruber]OWK38535.1 Ferredoxin [Fimbriiglobus ruber]
MKETSHAADDAGRDRREFLQTSGFVGAGLVAAAAARGADPIPNPLDLTNVGPDKIPLKPFGKTKERVSVIGLGGHTLGLAPTLKEAVAIAHEAIDAGVNFFDNAWEYHDGKSEEWMGEALKGRRDKVFLMTKVCTHGRDKAVAMKQLDESLKRLKTDHLDLWQVHEVVYDNDPDRHFAKGGVIEALDEAKKQGKVRYVGFTGHKHPDIHLKMLAHDYPFDAVQMPLNPFDGTYRSFATHVLPVLNKRGIAGLGMKSLGGNGRPVLKGIVTVEEALRYAMSLPVATTISGIDSLAVLRQNLAIARGFKPMTADEIATLRARCAAAAGDGHLEMYKSTVKYDGDIGREQHGFPKQKEMPV